MYDCEVQNWKNITTEFIGFGVILGYMIYSNVKATNNMLQIKRKGWVKIIPNLIQIITMYKKIDQREKTIN